MEKDKMLEQLFSDFKPELGSDDRFMASLERKLNAVEYIKRMQEAQLRRQRTMMLVVLALALVAGGVLFALMSRWPADVPLFVFHSDFAPLVFIEQNERTIFMILAAALSGYVTISIANHLQDMQEQSALRRQKQA